MSGYYGDLSPQQEAALAKYKSNIADVWKDSYDDYLCLRFLRARSFDVGKAEEMFRNHLAFRKKWNVDTILEDHQPSEVIKKYYAHGNFGVDRDGHPVAYQATGNADFKGMIKAIRVEEMTRHLIYLNELGCKICEDRSKEAGKQIETTTIIMDLENLSYQRHYHWPAIKAFQSSIKLLEDNYPERVKVSLIVKAPKVFPIAFNLIKPFLDERTRQKVKVLGSDWKEELQKYIDPDNLPEAYGGNRREPDAECTKYICPGGDIPEEYYLSNQTEASAEDFQVVQVGRGSSVQLEYHVEVVGTAISWEFLTADYDIGFGMYFKGVAVTKRVHKGDMVEIIASQRRNSHFVPEKGIYHCEEEGIHVLRFDNTYSWARSKEVRYSVSVLPPDPELAEHSQFMGVAGGRGKDRVAAGGEGRRGGAGEKEEGEQEDFKDAEDQEEVQPLKDLPSSSKEPSLPPLASEDVNSEAIQRDVPSDEVSNQTTPNGQEQCAGDTSAGNQEGVVCSNSDKESTEVTAPMSSSD